MIYEAIALYEHNIRFLLKHFPFLLKKLQALDKSRYRIGIEKMGEDYVVKYNEKIFKGIDASAQKHIDALIENIDFFNRVIFSSDPLSKAIDKYKSPIVSKRELFSTSEHLVIFGLMPAFHIEHLINLRVKNTYIYEPDFGMFLIFLHFINLEYIYHLSKKAGVTLHFFVDDDEQKVAEVVKSQIFNYLSMGEVVLGYYSYQSQKMESIQKYIQDYYLQFRLTPMRDYFLRVTKNFMENFSMNPSIFLRREEKVEYPVVIVGSGPSLQKHLSYLKKYQDKLFIISLTSTYKILYENGIKPDLVGIVDAGIALNGINVFKGVEESLKDVKFLSIPSIDSRFFKMVKKNYIASFEFFTPWFRYSLYKKYFFMATVIDMVLNFLFEAGIRKIAFIGVDLGTKDKKQYHAKGYDAALDREVLKREMKTVEGNFGEIVYSTADFLSTKKSIEEMIKWYSTDSALTIVNFSDGAKIEGAQAKKIEELHLFFTQKEEVSDWMDELFCLKIKDIPRNELDFNAIAIEMSYLLKAIKTKNYKKFIRYSKRTLNKLSILGNLHAIYEIRVLSKLYFRLQISKEPQKLFIQIMNDIQTEFYQMLQNVEIRLREMDLFWHIN